MLYEQYYSWQFLVTVILFASISILIVNGVYNRYFHPLAGFPGPFWSSVTDLSKLSALSTSDLTAFSLKLHQRYGMTPCEFPNSQYPADSNI